MRRAAEAITALLVILTGCSPGLDVNPEYEVAAPSGLAMPEVHWYGPQAVSCSGTCEDGRAWSGYTSPVTGSCVTGETLDGESIVLTVNDDWRTTLAHERVHATTGVYDHPAYLFGPTGGRYCDANQGPAVEMMLAALGAR